MEDKAKENTLKMADIGRDVLGEVLRKPRKHRSHKGRFLRATLNDKCAPSPSLVSTVFFKGGLFRLERLSLGTADIPYSTSKKQKTQTGTSQHSPIVKSAQREVMNSI